MPECSAPLVHLCERSPPPFPRTAKQNKHKKKISGTTTTATHAFTQTNDRCGALTAGAFMSLPKGPSHSSRLQKHNQQINTAHICQGVITIPIAFPRRLTRQDSQEGGRAVAFRAHSLCLEWEKKRKKHEKGVHGLRKKSVPPPPPKAKSLNGHHFPAKQKLVAYFVLKGLKVRRLEM